MKEFWRCTACGRKVSPSDGVLPECALCRILFKDSADAGRAALKMRRVIDVVIAFTAGLVTMAVGSAVLLWDAPWFAAMTFGAQVLTTLIVALVSIGAAVAIFRVRQV